LADSVEIKIETDEQKRLRKLKADFTADFRAESEWRKDKEQYGKFYDGDQLSDEEVKALEERGQPPVVINRIKPKLDSIFGIQEALQVDTKAYPAGDRQEEAEFVSEELRHIEDDSDLDSEESLVFEDICIDGRGWYKCFKEFDGLNGVDRVKHISNEKVVLDRYCTEEDRRTGDLKTAKRVHETIWTDLGDAQDMFPGHKEKLQAAVENPDLSSVMASDPSKEHNPDQYAQKGDTKYSDTEMEELHTYVDKKQRRIRIVTTHYRIPKVKKFLKSATGTFDITNQSEKTVERMMNELEGPTTWTETVWQLNTCTFAWNVILEKRKDIRPYDSQAKFPLIMAPGYVTRCKKKKPYGIVKQHMDPQKEVNKRRSKMLHLLNTNQVWYEAGAFEDEAKAKRESSRPDGWVKHKPQFKIERVTHEQLAQSQFQLLQESKQEIDTSGINKEVEGSSRANSARQEQLRQQLAQQPIRKLFVNLRAARKRIGYYFLDEILHRNPEVEIRKYDLIIDEAPDTINLQSETFEILASLAREGLPIPPEMIIEMSPLSPAKKKEFLDRMQQMQMAQQQAAMQAGQGAPQ